MFEIHLGVPEMEELWDRLEKKHADGSASMSEEKLRRKMGKAMVLLLSCLLSGSIWIIQEAFEFLGHLIHFPAMRIGCFIPIIMI